RLEVLSAGERVVIRFVDIARWHRRGWLWRPLAHLGWARGCPAVADRDWFHPPSGRFFAFYTKPPLVVYMPGEPADLSYGATMFCRVHNIIRAGGFGTTVPVATPPPENAPQPSEFRCRLHDPSCTLAR